MNVLHIAIIAAYPLKDELGGGFRGAMLDRTTRERTASERFETLNEAKIWAQTKAYEVYGHMDGYSVAALRRKGEFQANIWIAA